MPSACSDVRIGRLRVLHVQGLRRRAPCRATSSSPSNYKSGKKYPVAFIIHGGPQGAMTNDFHYRWNPQTYAGPGLRGRHDQLPRLDRLRPGIHRCDLRRLGRQAARGPASSAGRRRSQKYAFLDGDRACALGASYGGYMVYWIAGNWNEPWKCIVAHDGVFDAA